MKKQLLLLLLVLSGIVQAQIINIPDANFKNALLQPAGVVYDSNGNTIALDANNDNEIQESEALLAIRLDVSGQNIASLQGIEYFTNLEHLDCADNAITELDLSSAPALTNFIVNNCTALTYINIKNGTVLASPELTEMDNTQALNFVCVDEGEAAALAPYFPALNATTYCSFTPGGDYNTITGTLTFDGDYNGCDAGDVVQPFMKVTISDGATAWSAFTNAAGVYNFYTGAGNSTVTPDFEDDNYFTPSPATAPVNFPVVDNSTETENFCIAADGLYADIEVVMVPVTSAQPGFDAVYKIVYKNKGNTVLSGSVSCNWDYALLEYVNVEPMADINGAGTYTWNFTNLMPFENREIIMTLNVNSTTESPAVNVNDILPFNASAVIPATDSNPADNNFTLNQVVEGAYSQNDIVCIQGETVPPDAIGDYLHYVVNFNNTGTAPANTIVVRHELDESQFDIGTLQILNSSHDVAARVKDNIVEFIFQNANLAAADHGNILFKVRSKESLMPDDMITNNATIYFDYNAPIETNDANTTFAVLSHKVQKADVTVSVYPNPANDAVNITAAAPVIRVQFYDVQGRLLQADRVNETTVKIDISLYPSGIYFVKTDTENGTKITKLIKQ